jgi:diadenosine tetraphosphate (Ap4A) HIT family hydrolase
MLSGFIYDFDRRGRTMTWLEPQKWNDTITGRVCQMCREAPLLENESSYLIAENPHSFLRLAKKQQPRGWMIVVSKVHATELFHFSPSERQGFFDDVSRCAAALKLAFEPVKIQYGIFGAIAPHVHCHLFPKYLNDDPLAPLKWGDTEESLRQHQADEIIQRVKSALAVP